MPSQNENLKQSWIPIINLLIILLLIILQNYHALNLSHMLNMKEKGTIELCQLGQLSAGLFRFPHAGDDNLGNDN